MRKLIIVFLLSAVLGPGLFAEPAAPPREKGTRVISLDSSYWPTLNTLRGLGDFGLEFFDFSNLTFDWVNDALGGNAPGEEGYNNRSFYMGWYMTLSTYVFLLPYIFSYHEYGHGSRMNAAGYEATYHHFPDPWEPDFLAKTTYPNFFPLMASSILHFSGGYTHAGKRFKVIPSIPAYWWDLAVMSGVNSEMQFTQRLQDRTYLKGSHVQLYEVHLMGKASTLFYMFSQAIGAIPQGSTGDLTRIMDYYRSKGYRDSEVVIGIEGTLPLVLSASTWAYFSGLVNYFRTGDTKINTWEIESLRLPDLEFYHNPEGPSYRLDSGWHGPDIWIPFSLEFTASKDFRMEITAGVFWQTKDWDLSASFTGGLGLDASMSATYKIPMGNGALGLTLGFERWDENSLSGRRMINDLTPGILKGVEIYGKTSWVY